MRTVKTLVVVVLLTPFLAPGFPAVSQNCATPQDVEGIVRDHGGNISDQLRGISDEVARSVNDQLARASGKISDRVVSELGGRLEGINKGISEISRKLGEIDFGDDNINRKLDTIIRRLGEDSVNQQLNRIEGQLEDLENLSEKINILSKRVESIDKKIRNTVNEAVSGEFSDIQRQQEVLMEQNRNIMNDLEKIKDELGIENNSQEDDQ